LAICAPRPLPAPVTIAVFPARLNIADRSEMSAPQPAPGFAVLGQAPSRKLLTAATAAAPQARGTISLMPALMQLRGSSSEVENFPASCRRTSLPLRRKAHAKTRHHDGVSTAAPPVDDLAIRGTFNNCRARTLLAHTQSTRATRRPCTLLRLCGRFQ